MRRVHSDRPASITTAPENPAEELGRRQRRYAVMAVIFIASFTSAALLHRETAVALLLCGVAMTTLVLSVIGANVRSPRRRRAGPGHVVNEHRHLRSAPAKRPPEK
jgi:hypothetical protein